MRRARDYGLRPTHAQLYITQSVEINVNVKMNTTQAGKKGTRFETLHLPP